MRVKIDVNELVRRAGVLAEDLLKFRERNIEIPEYAYDISVGLEILTGYLRAISARVREILFLLLRLRTITPL